jgi:hypothetical protein
VNFRAVVTAAQVLTMVREAVEANATHGRFYSVWSDAKDRPSELVYPCVLWDSWTGRLVEDPDTGLLHRSQLVRLLVITSVETDRTPEERDQAVNAADQAAAEIVGVMRTTWRNVVEVSNVLITTQHDEGTTLDTGVWLSFTVRSVVGMCEDGTPGVLPATNPARINLDDLADVDATTPTDGAVLKYSAALERWVLATDETGGGGWTPDTTTNPGFLTLPDGGLIPITYA